MAKRTRKPEPREDPTGPVDAELRRRIRQAVRATTGERRPARVPERPPLRVMTTTLWEYPSQHYTDAAGNHEQGDKAYEGATPSWVIWQVLRRYTRPGEVVLDPMCGSGTTLDVARDLDRRGVGFDLAPTRRDIAKADARELPLEGESVDFVFIDPPYSTHIAYSEDPRCIGRLDAGAPPDGRRDEGASTGEAYYEALEEVFCEAHRVLRPDRCAAVYVSDSWRKRTGRRVGGSGRVPDGLFMPIGFELFGILRDYFEPVDLVAVARRNAKLQRGNWHAAAERENFFLRGFNHLIIVHKP